MSETFAPVSEDLSRRVYDVHMTYARPGSAIATLDKSLAPGLRACANSLRAVAYYEPLLMRSPQNIARIIGLEGD